MKFRCLFFLLLFSCLAEALALTPKVEIKSPSVILIDAASGAVLYEKNGKERRYPGSTTKVATALYALHVLENSGGDLEAFVEASREALHTVPQKERQMVGSRHPSYRLEVGGTSAGLKAGEKRPLFDLLHGLMLCSGNDAANVIAEYISGSVPQFLDELNAYLLSIGVKETQFTNPHGLHSRTHYTTAFDLALMMRKALESDHFRQVVRKARYTTRESNMQPPIQHVQFNALMRSGKHFYPRALGGKTGYTCPAGFCLVAAATHEGRTLVVAVLGSENKEQRYQETISLFDAGFAEKKISRMLLAKEKDPFTRAIAGASAPLRAALYDDIEVSYYPSENPSWKIEPVWEEKKIPIASGEKVGLLRLSNEKTGQIWAEYPLYSLERVDTTWKLYVRSAALFIAAHEWIRYSLAVAGFSLILLLFYVPLRRR